MDHLTTTVTAARSPVRSVDAAWLADKGYRHSLISEANLVSVVIHDLAMPAGIAPATSDLMVRLPAGFPDTAPDSFWLSPAVAAVGRVIPNISVAEMHGRSWQFWSRHLQPGQWNASMGLGSYVATVRRCIAEAAGTTP